MTEHNRILQGDCTEILKSVPDNSVDFLLNFSEEFMERVLRFLTVAKVSGMSV